MTADRIYTTLLRLYPKAFRDQYGDDMLAAFREMFNDRRGTLRFWRLVLVDTVRAAGAERLETVQWPAICLMGLLVTVGAAHTTAWTYRYFYHPYLEGVAIPAWTFGLFLGLVLGGTVAAGQWLLLSAPAYRARSWALASALVLPVAVLFCSAALDRALVSLTHPIGANPDLEGLRVLVVGLNQAANWTEIAAQFTAMAIGGLTVGMLTRPLVWRRHAH